MEAGMVTAQRIAIIGAGLSGMICAHRLQDLGANVTLFEKSRGAGGRMSTRRRDEATWDHGAQYFSARSEAFAALVNTWERAGVVARWQGRFASVVAGELRPEHPSAARFVGTPKMSSLGRHLSKGLTVHLQTRIASLTGARGAWSLRDVDDGRHGPFDLVLISAPGPQARALLPDTSELRERTETLSYAPCWAVMAEYEEPALAQWDGIKFDQGPLSWVARDSSKPGRPPGERWVLHASAAWTHAHLEDTKDAVIDALTGALSALGAAPPTHAHAHRWRYALSAPHPGSPAAFSPTEGLGLMGDGFIAPRVEAAWKSGMALSELVIAEGGPS